MTRRNNLFNPADGEPPPNPQVEQGLQLMASLNLAIGKLSEQIEQQRADGIKLAQSVRPIPGITVPQITTTNGTADYPELLAPRRGYWWDVKSITAATFTAGSVNLYAGASSDSTLRYVFTSAGTYAFGTAQLLVPPGQRLIFTAVAVTGNVSPSLSVVEVADWALASYLM